jgi:hypothetical protein
MTTLIYSTKQIKNPFTVYISEDITKNGKKQTYCHKTTIRLGERSIEDINYISKTNKIVKDFDATIAALKQCSKVFM